MWFVIGCGQAVRLLRVVGASLDSAASRERLAGPVAAEVAGQYQVERRGFVGTVGSDRPASGHDAGGAGRCLVHEGQRIDGISRFGEVEAAFKKKSIHAAEQERPDVKAARAA